MKKKITRIVTILVLVTLIYCLFVGVYVVVWQLHGISFQGKITVQGQLDPQNAGIFLYDRIFHTLRRITPQNIFAFSPAWSPDGKRMAFVYSNTDEVDFHVAVLDVDGGKIEPLIDKGIGDYLFDRYTALAWSPDGNQLLFDAVSDSCHALFLYQFDQKAFHPLTIQFCQPDTGSVYFSLNLSWSLNEVPLVGVSNQGFSEDYDDIYTLDQMLTKAEWIVQGSYPAWRPGTKDFSYLCWKTDSSFAPSICSYSLERRSATVIREDGRFEKYTWSPDGRFILFVEKTGESDPTFLSLINLRTGAKYHLKQLYSSLDEAFVPVGWFGGEAIWSSK